MAQVISTVLLVLLVAFTVVKVSNGTWCRTWAGSGQKPDGRRFPGGPERDGPVFW